jgi:arylsulfatase A-like enzyme
MIHRQAALLALVTLIAAAGCGGNVPQVSRVVIVTLDTTRADRIGCYGYEDAATPNLDAVAARGVLFERAVSQVPTTLPSHSTMFTGLYPQDHGVRYNIQFRLGPDAVTLAEVLKDAGFATAAFPASFIVGEKYGLSQGFDTWAEPPDPKEAENVVSRIAVMRPAEEGVELAMEWLAAHTGEKTFAWLHFYDPHGPYTPPFPYFSQYRDRPYDGEIAYTDAQFGRLMEALRGSPDWEETLIIVAGDHGEGLYEHRERFHGSLVYETTQHVPFIVHAPGIAPGRVEEPVALADIMPTVLDLARVPAPEPMRGISLRAALQGGSLEQRDIYFESLAGSLNYGWAELRGIRFDDWKLIDSDQPELFNLEVDPGEEDNLAGFEPERLQEMRDALRKLTDPITETGLAIAAQGAMPDAETQLDMAALGYLAVGSEGSAKDAIHPREVIDMEAELLAGQQAVAAQNWKVVEEQTRYILGRDPSNKWALNTLIDALLAQDRAREAQDVAADFVRHHPENENAYMKFARTYAAQGLHEEAYMVLQGGLKHAPDSFLLTYLMLVEGFEAGLNSICATEIPAVMARHPGTWQIIVLSARCQAAAGMDDEAAASLEEAVKAGFNRLEDLAEVPEFANVVDTPRFRRLLESVASDGSEEGESKP